MALTEYRFDEFVLSPGERRLSRGGAAVEINGRYLDALLLLVREQGRLVSKDRFMGEVWRGIPVTDEALTQCIRTLRRQLGDEAGRPRFIETVPKHGYRFIASVEPVEECVEEVPLVHDAYPSRAWSEALRLGAAGTVGGAVAGLVGGLLYGFAGASLPLAPGMGAVSVVLVLLSVALLIAFLGAAGVAFGIAGARLATGGNDGWSVLGGAAGGMVVGAFVKLLGLDVFNLLFGYSPGNITGAGEGAVLGGAVGLSIYLVERARTWSFRRGLAVAALIGGAAGAVISLIGGRLLLGSLDLLARHLPQSRLRLEEVGVLFGEKGMGPISQAVTAALEGALFSACLVGAVSLGGALSRNARR